MGNDDSAYHIEMDKIDIDLENWSIGDIGESLTVTIADLKDPYYDCVEVQESLKAEQLRQEHADLQAAYKEYTTLLEKYTFWDTIKG